MTVTIELPESVARELDSRPFATFGGEDLYADDFCHKVI